MMTDTLADMLTRIRNANQAALETVDIPYSVLKERVARVIMEEGYLNDLQVVDTGARKKLVLKLKYLPKRARVLSGLSRVSRPGRRVYMPHDKLGKVRGGMGIMVLSTPKGVMTDTQAREQHVGGEALCKVW